MSRRRLTVLAAALAICTGSAPAQRAAGTGALAARYRGQLDAARRLVATNDSLIRVVAARRVASYSTPVTRGTITILTSPEMSARAAEILRRADSIADVTPYGTPADLRVTYRLMVMPPRNSLDTTVRWRFVHPSDPAQGFFQTHDDSVNVRRASQALAEVASANAAARVPAAMRAWFGARPGARDDESRWEQVYSILATSPAIVTRTCLEGQLTACRETLRIQRPADPLSVWYTPAGRRSLVVPLARPELRTPQRLGVDAAMPGGLAACVERNDDAVCTAILRAHFDSNTYLRPAGTDIVEESLIQAAVALSGAPGIGAVIGKESLTLPQAIEAIAGRPLDEVIQLWIDRVKAAKVDSVEMKPSRAVAATAWLLVFGALAIGGTRWRSR